MKHLTTLLLTLLVLGGCGYSSEQECRVKEMQKCESGACEREAKSYCDSEFPSETKTVRYIYNKQNYPQNWVNVNVDSFRVYIQEAEPRMQRVLVCLDKEWTLGKGKCETVWLNNAKNYPKGISWSYRDSGADTFYKYINETGDGLKEGTRIDVYERESVGFFRYHLSTLLWFIGVMFLFGLIGSLLDSKKHEEENEENEEEENIYGMDFEEGDEVEIPEREQLESMTKDEIKAWADVFEFNVPLSLTRVEMINRFVEETDAYVESLEE